MLTKKQLQLLLHIHTKLQENGVSPSFDEMKEALGLKSKSGIHRLISALEERGFLRRLPNRARALEVLKLPEGADGTAFTTSPAHPGGLAGHTGLERGFHPSVIHGGLAEDPAPAITGHNGENTQNAPSTQGNTPSAEGNVIAGRFGGGHAGSGPQISRADHGGGDLPQHNNPTVELPVMGRIAAGIPISAIENKMNTISLPADMFSGGEHFALEVQGDSMIEAGILDGDTVLIKMSDTATNGDVVVALVDEEEATLKTFARKGSDVVLKAANPQYEDKILPSARVRVQGKLVGLLRQYP